MPSGTWWWLNLVNLAASSLSQTAVIIIREGFAERHLITGEETGETIQ